MTLRRTRLERRRPLARGRGLSVERDAELDVPPATRDLLRQRSRGRCEAARYAAGCTQAATDVHHRKRRRDGGHAIANLVDLCRACHRWAHDHPAEARDLGLIVSAFADPAEAPLLVLHRATGERWPALLTDDGAYQLAGAA